MRRVSPDDGTQDALDPERLVDRYGERIYQIAYRMTGKAADAEDVAQNTLLKILRKRDSFRGDSDPMGWIYRITMNEARELHRRRKRRPTVSLDQLPIDFDETNHTVGIQAIPTSPTAGVEAREVEEVIREAIQELPDGYREAVVLLDLEGLSYKQAAELMGLTLGGFKTRLHRARLHLRNRLQDLHAGHASGDAGPKGESA